MNTVLLVSTFAKMAKFIPAVEIAIDRCWPTHPTVYFISDYPLPSITNQFFQRGASWTQVLLHGLSAVGERYPGLDYIFLMLDDHCPLQACDPSALTAYFDIVRRHQLAVVWFPTFEWPWKSPHIAHPAVPARSGHRIEIEELGDRRFAVVPRDFFRYFSLQPACWDIQYLTSVCRTALDSAITDPWRFEQMAWDGARQHYVAEYNWPSVHHGFMAAGKLNPAAISYMSRTAVPELHKQLIREAGFNSVFVYQLYRMLKIVLRFLRIAVKRIVSSVSLIAR
jgi:hypothetical protein